MKIRLTFFLSLIGYFVSSAQQLDSARLQFFPLHQGDIWQYFYGNYTGQGYLKNQQVIAVDTVVPNGLHYVAVTGSPYVYFTKFYRVDSLLRVQEYYPLFGDTCGGTVNEVNIFRLGEPDSSIWRICYNVADQLIGKPYYFRFNGVFSTWAFDTLREAMVFQAGGHTMDADTTFWDVSPHFVLIKGIGLYSMEHGEGDYVQLKGAIVNGVKYGTIKTSVQEGQSVVCDFFLAQNYPNPFNGRTLITFSISRPEFVRLSVHDILGREVSVLVNQSEVVGTHTTSFYASNQSSGVYFYRLIAGHNSQTRCMVIQK